MRCTALLFCGLQKKEGVFMQEIKQEDVMTDEEQAGGTALSGEQESADAGRKLYTAEELEKALSAEREMFAKKLAEAEKLAAMSESERDDHRREMLERSLAEREAAVARRELAAEAAEKLSAAGLPKQLAACLDYSGREECDKSLETVGRAFEESLTAAVNQRMRGIPPKFAPGGAKDAFLDGLGVYGS